MIADCSKLIPFYHLRYHLSTRLWLIAHDCNFLSTNHVPNHAPFYQYIWYLSFIPSPRSLQIGRNVGYVVNGVVWHGMWTGSWQQHDPLFPPSLLLLPYKQNHLLISDVVYDYPITRQRRTTGSMGLHYELLGPRKCLLWCTPRRLRLGTWKHVGVQCNRGGHHGRRGLCRRYVANMSKIMHLKCDKLLCKCYPYVNVTIWNPTSPYLVCVILFIYHTRRDVQRCVLQQKPYLLPGTSQTNQKTCEGRTKDQTVVSLHWMERKIRRMVSN